MDAKPQRVGKLRVLPGAASSNDENMDPARQLAAHDRSKSFGSLKPAVNMTGAMNVAPKRAAFGDLSNTSKAIGDLGTLGTKDLIKSRFANLPSWDQKPTDKENQLDNALAVVASHKNASGPAGLGRASTVQPSIAPALSSKAPSVANSSVNPAPKHGVAKKATLVFQDQKLPSAIPPTSLADLVSAEDLHHKNPRHYKSQPYLKSQQPVLRRTQSKHFSSGLKPVELEDELIGVAFEDAVEQLPENIELPEDDHEEDLADDEPNVIVHPDISPYQPLGKEFSASAGISEPEEYWDDEDDQEQDLYDDQGFTTAHSYRSHGDNTTGGPTTMIAPKITANIQKELEMAKVVVLENQTEEEAEEEAWDVSMVAEYGDEIFDYMRDLEARMLPNPHYMDIQTEIQWSMRSVLMDWLVQVHHRFSLLPETLFLTVNYIDRFLSVKVVSLGKLQLVGATAIFVAAKYEEINCPSVQEIVYMVDQGYSVEEILKAERFMLAMLNFELGWPGPMSFLRRISKADDYDLETRTLAKYFLEVTIMDERFVSSPPSYLAAGAHCLARMMLKKGDWTPAHVHYSGYTLAQLKPLVVMILECCQDPHKHHNAVHEKYSSSKYKRASTYVEGEVKKGFTLHFPLPPLISASSAVVFEDSSRFDYGNSGSLLIPAES